MSEKQSVMVIGSTRGTGNLVVHQLISQGIPCIVMARNPSKARNLYPQAAKIIYGDVTQTDSLESALNCDLQALVYTVDVTGGLGGRGFFLPRKTIRDVVYQGVVNTVNAAKTTGKIKQFILLSTLGANNPSWLLKILDLIKPGAVAASQDKVEYLKRSGLNYTIVQAGILQNKPTTNRPLVINQKNIQMQLNTKISRANLAQVMVSCIGNTHTYNRSFNVYGGREVILNSTELQSQLSLLV